MPFPESIFMPLKPKNGIVVGPWGFRMRDFVKLLEGTSSRGFEKCQGAL